MATSSNGTDWTALGSSIFNSYTYGVASNNSPNLYPAIGNTAVAKLQVWQNSSGGTLSVVDGYGNFGIGTDITGTSRLNIKGKDDTTSYYSLMAGGASTIGLAVRNDGNVGIGTISPTAKLDIKGNTTEATLGSELVINGSFTGNANNWTLNGTKWTYNSDNVIHASGETSTLTQSLGTLAAGIIRSASRLAEELLVLSRLI